MSITISLQLLGYTRYVPSFGSDVVSAIKRIIQLSDIQIILGEFIRSQTAVGQVLNPKIEIRIEIPANT